MHIVFKVAFVGLDYFTKIINEIYCVSIYQITRIIFQDTGFWILILGSESYGIMTFYGLMSLTI